MKNLDNSAPEKKIKDKANQYEEFGSLLSGYADSEGRNATWLSKELDPPVYKGTTANWLNGRNRPRRPALLYQACDLLRLTEDQSIELFTAAGYAYLKTEAAKKQFLDEKLGAAIKWDRKEREEEYLYRGGDLAELREFVDARERETPDIIQEFLDASIKHQKAIDRKEKRDKVSNTTLAGFLGGSVGAMLWVLLYAEPENFWSKLVGTLIVSAFIAIIISFLISISKEFGPFKMILPLIVGCIVGTTIPSIQLRRALPENIPMLEVNVWVSLVLGFFIALCMTKNNTFFTLFFCLISIVLVQPVAQSIQTYVPMYPESALWLNTLTTIGIIVSIHMASRKVVLQNGKFTLAQF